jgi:hypothetical protein
MAPFPSRRHGFPFVVIPLPTMNRIIVRAIVVLVERRNIVIINRKSVVSHGTSILHNNPTGKDFRTLHAETQLYMGR